MVRHAGDAPALPVWKTDVLAVTPMTHLKWPLDLDLHQDLLLFRETRRLTTPSSDDQ